jgi:hypothetical protein
VHAEDAAVGCLEQRKFAAGDRIGIEPTQVALGARTARIFQQLIERARVLALRPLRE